MQFDINMQQKYVKNGTLYANKKNVPITVWIQLQIKTLSKKI